MKAALPGIEAVATQPYDQPSMSTTSALGLDLSHGHHEFQNGTLILPDAKFKITDHRVLPAGSSGNEGGHTALVIFNVTVKQTGNANFIAPNDWYLFITASQAQQGGENVPLEPSYQLTDLDRSTANIPLNQGQSTNTYFTFELKDETAPVELIAVDNSSSHEIGRQVYGTK